MITSVRGIGSFVRPLKMVKESHSRMLGHKDVIYALQTHNLKPGTNSDYLKNYGKIIKILSTEITNGPDLIGSWNVQVGNQDQNLHLWRYNSGFKNIDSVMNNLDIHKEYNTLLAMQGVLLRSRHLQYLLAFTFWPKIEFRPEKHVYEIRSYTLRPGTMIEWGNNWARGIQYRTKNNEAFAGFFSQVGRLYNVHHIWCYKSLNDRKEVREASWSVPGWDQCVNYTVPLIQEMHCRILKPNNFSPTQ